MLIRNASVLGTHAPRDVRIADGRIVEVSTGLTDGERTLDARGGLLLPGLHDHHIHLAAMAAKAASVQCGPPDVVDEAGLTNALRRPGSGWLRGIGYHESVAGMLDAAGLDRMVPDRPVRIQHRSGRMWFLNSAGLEMVLAKAPPPPGLERHSGRLFDEDAWLRRTLAGSPPGFAEVGAVLGSYGITGMTDMSPANDPAMARHFATEQDNGALPQRCLLAGALSLAGMATTDRLCLGPAKLHLHEAELPPHDDSIAFIGAAHAQDRPVAIHCTTETELVFALAAMEAAGAMPGDRIEHASVAPDHLVAEIARLGLRVVSQPHFIAERGDQYRTDVDAEALPWLYRLRAFRDAGVTLAGGSDAPFGDADPWAAMAAAVSRRTGAGHVLGQEEALAPEEALALFLADPEDLTRQRRIEPGAPADLCLLDHPWVEARERLSAFDVRCTIAGGRLIHDRVDQPPG